MLRIRHGWLVVLLAVGSVAVAACKKDEKSDSPTGVKSAEVASGDDLSLLPADSELVLGVNAGQLTQSALWKQLFEAVRAQKKLGKLDDFVAKCGYDPTTSVKTVAAGVKGFDGNSPDGVIVVHGLDKTKTLSCMDKMKPEMAEHGTEVTQEGDVFLMKNKQGGPTAVTFINDSTAVMVIGSNATAAGVKSVIAGSSPLKSSAAFTAMYSKLKTTDSLWFLLNGKVLDKAAMIGAKPKGVFGSLNVTDGLSLDTKIQVETADAATAVAADLKQKSQMAATMVDKLDVTSEGDLVKVSVVLSNQKLQALIAQFGAMFGLSGLGAK
jgi:hypothetical protein